MPAALSGHGWTEGNNLVVERRYAGGDLQRLPALAAELVALNVDVIYAASGRAGLAAKAATNRIPIVTQSGEMVRQGLVTNLARPGGNVTGHSVMSGDIDVAVKRLQLLREMLPTASRIAVFGCGPPGEPDATKNWSWPSTASAARRFKVELRAYTPTTLDEIAASFKSAETQTNGILFFDCPYFNGLEPTLLLRHSLPAMYPFEAYAHYGGLVAYGYDEILLQQRQAWYIDRILRGAKPADLPVEQITKLRLVINLKTAQKLRITIPESLLARADEIVQ
jgi:putative tryptophan/tyrosine transport system substrate-binding protein